MKRYELTRRDTISLVGAVGPGVSTARLLGFESQRPTGAQSDKVQVPTQASTAPTVFIRSA